LRWRAFALEALHLDATESEASSLALPNSLALALELRDLRDAHPSPLATDPSHRDAKLMNKLTERANRLADQGIELAVGEPERVLANAREAQDGGSSLYALSEALNYYEAVRDGSSPSINNLRKRVEEEIASMEAEPVGQSLREYQNWALEETQRFEKRLNSLKGLDADRGWRSSADKWIWSDDEAALIVVAMTDHLLHIDPMHLDLPVMKLYQSAFDYGWSTLENESDASRLTCVAMASAIIPKRNPGRPLTRSASYWLKQSDQWQQTCAR